jgi:hypothetical protein
MEIICSRSLDKSSPSRKEDAVSPLCRSRKARTKSKSMGKQQSCNAADEDVISGELPPYVDDAGDVLISELLTVLSVVVVAMVLSAVVPSSPSPIFRSEFIFMMPLLELSRRVLLVIEMGDALRDVPIRDSSVLFDNREFATGANFWRSTRELPSGVLAKRSGLQDYLRI